ncbi:MAG TPA: ankyrin repeat domain-containing protein [Burkholderiales bacterium]|nr:ankyrin repeat domain-containing protein [Burkholderiales bacterium]
MAKSGEKLDFLTRLRIREFALMGLITLTAILANLPEQYGELLGLNRNVLFAVLAIAVIVGLFLYLKFGLFVAVVLLIAAANLPEQIADGLNISKIPIVLALVALVGIGLINTLVKILPTGLEPKPKEKSSEAVVALFYAIEKSNLVYAQKVLSMNFDPNVVHDNGYTPLGFAAVRGNSAMVELLLRNGADPNLASREGATPVELALQHGHSDTAEVLKAARAATLAAAPAAEETAAQAA